MVRWDSSKSKLVEQVLARMNASIKKDWTFHAPKHIAKALKRITALVE